MEHGRTEEDIRASVRRSRNDKRNRPNMKSVKCESVEMEKDIKVSDQEMGSLRRLWLPTARFGRIGSGDGLRLGAQ